MGAADLLRRGGLQEGTPEASDAFIEGNRRSNKRDQQDENDSENRSQQTLTWHGGPVHTCSLTSHLNIASTAAPIRAFEHDASRAKTLCDILRNG
jgi:hypothetical protein